MTITSAMHRTGARPSTRIGAATISRDCARQVVRRDFEAFDLVLAMDRGHLRSMERLCALDMVEAALRGLLDHVGVHLSRVST